MDEATDLTPEQSEARAELDFGSDQVFAFLKGEAVVYLLQTDSEPGIAILQRVGVRLRSGVVEVCDPGGGLKTFARFRGRSRRVAVAFGLAEVELFGAAVVNQKLAGILASRGY